jgi:hypothetical protein
MSSASASVLRGETGPLLLRPQTRQDSGARCSSSYGIEHHAQVWKPIVFICPQGPEGGREPRKAGQKPIHDQKPMRPWRSGLQSKSGQEDKEEAESAKGDKPAQVMPRRQACLSALRAMILIDDEGYRKAKDEHRRRIPRIRNRRERAHHERGGNGK